MKTMRIILAGLNGVCLFFLTAQMIILFDPPVRRVAGEFYLVSIAAGVFLLITTVLVFFRSTELSKLNREAKILQKQIEIRELKAKLGKQAAGENK